MITAKKAGVVSKSNNKMRSSRTSKTDRPSLFAGGSRLTTLRTSDSDRDSLNKMWTSTQVFQLTTGIIIVAI
jgi:hypothetical protein